MKKTRSPRLGSRRKPRRKTKVKIHRKVTLAKEIQQMLENQKLTPNRLNKCYHLLYLLGDGTRDRYAHYEWQPLANNYLKQTIGTTFQEIKNLLRDLGILECDDLFYEGKACCYRISNTYAIQDEITTATFSYYRTIPLYKYDQDKKYTEDFIANVRELNIPYVNLYQKIEEIVESISLEDAINGDDIPWEEGKARKVYRVNQYGEYQEKYLKKEAALKEAEVSGMELIQEKSSIKMMFKDDYISAKKHYIRQSYINAIESLKSNDCLYATRNGTNFRLDTNFTSLASDLFDIILEENDMVEIDQATSQPAFLAHILRTKKVQGDDVIRFRNLATKGYLYQYFATELGVPRGQAKQMMFEVLFSSAKVNSANKRLFKKTFPGVWIFIKDYKKKYGYKNFSIMLQQLESSIFIDKIYEPLIEEGLVIFSKHDSIACRVHDLPRVFSHITKVYKKENFKGVLKIKEFKKAA